LFPSQVAAAYFHEELNRLWPESFPPVTIVASHEGQVQRATHFLSVLQSLSSDNIELAILTKSATGGDPTLTGNVKDRVCIMVDDIVNTGTTIVKSTKVLKDSGAAKIFGWATHGVFTKEALERLANQEDMEFFLTSNSLYHEELPSKVRSLNIAPLLAEAIARMFNKDSLKSLMYLDSYLADSAYHDRYDSEL
jgi:phosphoribosylpyrophosphate synthetase